MLRYAKLQNKDPLHILMVIKELERVVLVIPEGRILGNNPSSLKPTYIRRKQTIPSVYLVMLLNGDETGLSWETQFTLGCWMRILSYRKWTS